MRAIGLSFSDYLADVSVVDESGELVEFYRASESELRQRFASMPPSVIAVSYDPARLRLLERLSAMGHAIVWSGPVPDLLRVALAPMVSDCAYDRVVCRQSPGDGSVGLAFSLDVDVRDGRRSIREAWYHIGPVLDVEDLSGLESVVRRIGAPAPSEAQALRLRQLLDAGEIAVEAAADYRGVVAA